MFSLPRGRKLWLLVISILAFLAVGVSCNEYQIPIPGSEMASEDIDDLFVPVYCLSKLSKGEEQHMETALQQDDDEINPLPWVKPRLVPWTQEHDGSIDDLYRLYRELRDDTDQERSEFFFFLDRRCVEEKKVIIADPDQYTLLYANGNMQELNDLIKKHDARVPEMNEAIVEKVVFELLDRAMTYGRIPANAFRSTWANLDIGNMGMSEIVEMYGGTVELYRNPDWNETDFVEKAEKANTELEEEKKQKKRG